MNVITSQEEILKQDTENTNKKTSKFGFGKNEES